MENDIYYVYALCNPLDWFETSIKIDKCKNLNFRPYYIGKGKNYRAIGHLLESKKYTLKDLKDPTLKINKHKIYKMKSIHEIYFPIFLAEGLSEQEAWDIEKNAIENIGLENLTNIRGGGEGGACSDETKLKLSKSRLGKSWEDRFGKDKAMRAREKLSKKCTGINNNMYGKNNQVYIKGGIFDHSTRIKKGKKVEDWMGEEKGKSFREKRRELTKGYNNGRSKYIINFEKAIDCFINGVDIIEYSKLIDIPPDAILYQFKKIGLLWYRNSNRNTKFYKKTKELIEQYKNRKEVLVNRAKEAGFIL